MSEVRASVMQMIRDQYEDRIKFKLQSDALIKIGMPSCLKNESIHEHDLVLQIDGYEGLGYYCDVCERSGGADCYAYHCEECSYDVHPICMKYDIPAHLQECIDKSNQEIDNII